MTPNRLSKPKQVASPISTGGVGNDFERRVGAYYLAKLLLGTVPVGQKAGVVQEVRFQRLYDGEPLDDLIVISRLPAGQSKLALQIKRDIRFGEKDRTFNQVICDCWATFTSPKFSSGLDQFGIVVALYAKRVDEHYQDVLKWARDSVSAGDFMQRISAKGLSSKTKNNFVKLIRTILNQYSGRNIGDDDLWEFLRSMVILRFDFLNKASNDCTSVIAELKSLLPAAGTAEPQDLFRALIDYAAEANGTAGSFNFTGLKQRLIHDGLDVSHLEDPLWPNAASILDNVYQTTIRRQRDVKTLKALLETIDTTALDQFFVNAISLLKFDSSITIYNDWFEYQVAATSFHIHDKELAFRIDKFLRAWNACLSYHSNLHIPLRSSFVHFLDDGYQDLEIARSNFLNDLKTAKQAYLDFISYVQEEYVELDVNETNKVALEALLKGD